VTLSIRQKLCIDLPGEANTEPWVTDMTDQIEQIATVSDEIAAGAQRMQDSIVEVVAVAQQSSAATQEPRQPKRRPRPLSRSRPPRTNCLTRPRRSTSSSQDSCSSREPAAAPLAKSRPCAEARRNATRWSEGSIPQAAPTVSSRR
jgi:hypothetical protein